MLNSRIESIKIVAEGLGNLNKEVIFVGGAVTELYASQPETSLLRVTLDVDCIIRITTIVEYHKLETILRAKGFEHDINKNSPLCRWRYQNILVDIMPTNEKILGFTNKWYSLGFENKMVYQLSEKLHIYILSPEYYLAAKIEAFNNRGGTDLRQSHDFEDIIYLLENDSSLLSRLANSDKPVKTFITSEFSNLVRRADIIEGIECALPFGSEIENTQEILNLAKAIAVIK